MNLHTYCLNQLLAETRGMSFLGGINRIDYASASRLFELRLVSSVFMAQRQLFVVDAASTAYEKPGRSGLYVHYEATK